MSKIYNFPLDTRNTQLVEQPFSLYQLMHGVPDHKDERTRIGDCYVTGIRFVRNGSDEFEKLLEGQIKSYERMGYTPEQIDSFLSELRRKERIIVTTKFVAVTHPLVWNETTLSFRGLDGCPYRGFVTDFNRLAVLHPEERRIAVVPYDGKAQHRLLFHDISGSKMAGARWQYDGTLADAMIEFAETYSFDIGRNPAGAKEALGVKGAHPKDSSRDYIVTSENVPLQKVLEFMSQ